PSVTRNNNSGLSGYALQKRTPSPFRPLSGGPFYCISPPVWRGILQRRDGAGFKFKLAMPDRWQRRRLSLTSFALRALDSSFPPPGRAVYLDRQRRGGSTA